MFMWQLLTAVWVRYTVSSVTWIVRKIIIIVHSCIVHIKRSSDLGMLTLQIFIITWTPTLRESRRLGDLNLGKAWLRWLCAGISPKSRRSNLTRFTSHAIFRRLTLHWCRGAAKAYWFSVELFCPRQIHGCRGFSCLSVKSVTNEKCQFAHRRPKLTSLGKRERLFSDT